MAHDPQTWPVKVYPTTRIGQSQRHFVSASGRVLLDRVLENLIVYELLSLGFGPFFEQQLEASDDSKVIPARIAAEHRGAYDVWSKAGSGRAQLAGRLRLELEEDALPGVGDWVVVKGFREHLGENSRTSKSRGEITR